MSYPEEYREGTVVFYGRPFFVSPDTLIPRLETEVLVRQSLALIDEYHLDHVIDLWAGSGCVGLSLLSERKQLIGTLVDISEGALAISEKNRLALWLMSRTVLTQSNLLSGVKIECEKLLIVGNLPYIAEHERPLMSEDTLYEPETALMWGGSDGLQIIKRAMREIHAVWLSQPNISVIAVALEIGEWQWEGMRDISRELLGQECSVIQDYAWTDRVCTYVYQRLCP